MVLDSLVIALIINGAMFLAAFRLRSDKLTDISYAVTFIALAMWALKHNLPGSVYTVGAAVLVIIWALRIGSFLLYRVIKTGRDKRFDGMRDSFWRFGKFWLGQA